MFRAVIRPDCELRLHEERDAEALYALVDANRDYLAAWLPWALFDQSPDDTRAFIRRSRLQFARGAGFQAGIWQHGTLIGGIGLHEPKLSEGQVSVGYWIAEAQAGQGIVTAATRRLIDHAFAAHELHRVFLEAATDNSRSRAVAERLGMTYEGTLRESLPVATRRLSMAVYSVLRPEWPAEIAPLEFAWPIAPGAELRLMEPRFAPEYFALIDANRGHLAPWMSWVDQHQEIADTRRYLEGVMLRWAEGHGSYHAGLWFEGTLIGSVSLQEVERRFGSASIGYWIDAGHQGRGLIGAAVQAMLFEAFTQRGLHRIQINVQPENERSLAIPRRFGFTHEGRLRERAQVAGSWVDWDVFSLLASEWMP